MHCPQCDAPNREHAKFCRACGHHLAPVEARAPMEMVAATSDSLPTRSRPEEPTDRLRQPSSAFRTPIHGGRHPQSAAPTARDGTQHSTFDRDESPARERTAIPRYLLGQRRLTCANGVTADHLLALDFSRAGDLDELSLAVLILLSSQVKDGAPDRLGEAILRGMTRYLTDEGVGVLQAAPDLVRPVIGGMLRETLPRLGMSAMELPEDGPIVGLAVAVVANRQMAGVSLGKNAVFLAHPTGVLTEPAAMVITEQHRDASLPDDDQLPTVTDTLMSGDLILACSAGMLDALTEDDLSLLLATRADPWDVTRRLVAASQERQPAADISALAVVISDDAAGLAA